MILGTIFGRRSHRVFDKIEFDTHTLIKVGNTSYLYDRLKSFFGFLFAWSLHGVGANMLHNHFEGFRNAGSLIGTSVSATLLLLIAITNVAAADALSNFVAVK